jgi:tetratricopeptide (TPR) repeat protein
MALSIFAAAFVVRLVHVLQMRSAPFFSVLMGDSHGYDVWAQQIARGDWLGREVFYQAPLYPYLLGSIYASAGRDLLLVRIVQILIGSASCSLLGLATARLFSTRAGWAAGLALALYAPAIFFDGLLQKSVLDVFFVCLAVWLITKTDTAQNGERSWFDKLTMSGETDHGAARVGPARPEPVEGRVRRLHRGMWLCLGLAMGGLALTRENALVFIAVILAWAAFAPSNQQRSTAQRAHAAASFLLGVAIVVLPVAARNAYVGGGFYVTTSQFGPNFYIGNNPASDGTYQALRFGRGAPEYERQDATELAERALGRKLSPAEVSSFWTDKALDFMTGRPVEWLALMARKIALLWNATEMLDTESQEAHAEWSWPLRIGGLFGHFGILVPLALLGAVATWPMRSRLWIFYAMTLAYAASVVMFYVFARYRYPLVPLLMMFAAAGLVAIPALVRSRSVPGGAWTLAAIVLAAIFTNWPILSTTLMRAITETNLAVALQAEGRLDEAIDRYRRAIAMRPEYAPAYNNLGTALHAKGRHDEAIATYQRALGLRLEYPQAHYNLANALNDAGRPREAAEHFRIALQTIGGSADVHNNLGIALMGQGKTAEAIAEFRTAVQLEPESAKSRRNLADALASAGQYDEAIDQFRRAARLDPTGAANYDLGSLFLELDRTEEAIAEFRASLKRAPDDAQTHNNLGIALGIQGRLDDAIGHFQRALAVQPDFEDARKNLALAQGQKKGSTGPTRPSGRVHIPRTRS